MSLTGLDQTAMEYFNPSNAFDAEGLTRLTEEIELRKKLRNDIEQDTMIAMRKKNLESEKLSLSIDQESEYSRPLHFFANLPLNSTGSILAERFGLILEMTVGA